jgi:hypothetical protein
LKSQWPEEEILTKQRDKMYGIMDDPPYKQENIDIRRKI